MEQQPVNPGDDLVEYGFDESSIRARLALLELSPTDRPLSEVLHDQVVVPNIDFIVDDFYEYLGSHRVYQEFLQPYNIIRLKQTQRNYLLSLGQDFGSKEYFRNRVQVGLAHERVGLKLSLYQCAYRKLTEIILGYIPQSTTSQKTKHVSLSRFISKVIALDTSLAIEAYYLTKVRVMKQTLSAVRHEGMELRQKVDTDRLTGVASKEHITTLMERALERAKKSGKPLCIVMQDLDHFKEVNDTHGHLIGDQVLQEVASRLTSALRLFDTVGRYGGEEFVVILENTDLERAREISERVRTHVSGAPIHVDDKNVPLTISQGVALARPEDDLSSILGRADKALYAAKEAGRDRVVLGE